MAGMFLAGKPDLRRHRPWHHHRRRDRHDRLLDGAPRGPLATWGQGRNRADSRAGPLSKRRGATCLGCSPRPRVASTALRCPARGRRPGRARDATSSACRGPWKWRPAAGNCSCADSIVLTLCFRAPRRRPPRRGQSCGRRRPRFQAALQRLEREVRKSGAGHEPIEADINPSKTVAIVSVPLAGKGIGVRRPNMR